MIEAPPTQMTMAIMKCWMVGGYGQASRQGDDWGSMGGGQEKAQVAWLK